MQAKLRNLLDAEKYLDGSHIRDWTIDIMDIDADESLHALRNRVPLLAMYASAQSSVVVAHQIHHRREFVDRISLSVYVHPTMNERSYVRSLSLLHTHTYVLAYCLS